MLNKPAGVITATEDGQMRTVLDLLRESVSRKGLFPVGRLDRDTEGLLLITDDGQLAHRLLAPGKHVDKTYYALVSGRVTEEDIRAFEAGIEVGGEFTAMPALLSTDPGKADTFKDLIPADIREILPPEITQYSQTLVTIREGKYHQIKRMFAARGKEVLYLKRLAMGPLCLDASLAAGQYRPLEQEEIDLLSVSYGFNRR
jgi:16S rRNA pseudouridine516 synthase